MKKLSLVLAFLSLALSFVSFKPVAVSGVDDVSARYWLSVEQTGAEVVVNVKLQSNASIYGGVCGLSYDSKALQAPKVEAVAGSTELFDDGSNGNVLDGVANVIKTVNLNDTSTGNGGILFGWYNVGLAKGNDTLVSSAGLPQTVAKLTFAKKTSGVAYTKTFSKWNLALDGDHGVEFSGDWDQVYKNGEYQVVSGVSYSAGEAVKYDFVSATIGTVEEAGKFQQNYAGYGNSPYGLIMRDDSITDKAKAQSDFDASGDGGAALYAYNGKHYSARAWEGFEKNYDRDAYAVFVYDGQYVEPAYRQKVDGLEIKIKVVDSRDKEITAGLGGVYTLSDKLAKYTVKYEVKHSDGGTENIERAVFTLPKVGDVDASGAVDAGDAMAILSRFKTPLVFSNVSSDDALLKLYLYRVCDFNMDGVVNAVDAADIIGGKGLAQQVYYPDISSLVAVPGL